MDLVDLIESRQFLGSEFLTWLWFKTECYDGLVDIDGFGQVDVIFDDRMTLESYLAETEKNVIKGGEPAYSPEAKTALREGKAPVSASFKFIHDGREWSFRFKSEGFAMTSVKIPAVKFDRKEEQFYERMKLVSDLEAMIEVLYEEFLTIRLSPLWDDQMVPAIEDWIGMDSKAGSNDYPEGIYDEAAELDLPDYSEYATQDAVKAR
jgi:hypothetical protein